MGFVMVVMTDKKRIEQLEKELVEVKERNFELKERNLELEKYVVDIELWKKKLFKFGDNFKQP